MSSTMCANEEGYAGSGRVNEASVLATLDPEDCWAGPPGDSAAAFGRWDSSVGREANHDLKAEKSRGGVSFFFLRRRPKYQQTPDII